MTGPSTVDQACAVFRSDEPAHAHRALILVGDTLAQVTAALWIDPEPKVPDSRIEAGSWEWAWSHVDIPATADAIEAASGRPADTVERKIRLLKRARLIYPDGTISAKASEILRAVTVEHVGRAVSQAQLAKRGGRR